MAKKELPNAIEVTRVGVELVRVGPNGVEWLAHADSLVEARTLAGSFAVGPEERLIAIASCVDMTGFAGKAAA